MPMSVYTDQAKKRQPLRGIFFGNVSDSERGRPRPPLQAPPPATPSGWRSHSIKKTLRVGERARGEGARAPLGRRLQTAAP